MKRLYSIILIVLLTACGTTAPAAVIEEPSPTIPEAWLTKPPTPVVEATATQLAAAAEEATAAPTAANEQPPATPTENATSTPVYRLPSLFGRQWTVSAVPGVPEELIIAARGLATDRPDDFLWVEPNSLPTDITLALDGQTSLADWLYVAAAPFPTIEDETTTTALQALWSTPVTEERSLFVVRGAERAFADKWGEPGVNVQVVEEAELASSLWEQRPSLAILPLTSLTPDLKVLRLDGQSPFDDAFDLETYPLAIDIGVDGEQEALAAFIGAWDGQESNFDRRKLTKVAMTGVTALVRATATQMEIDGILSPAADVGEVLRAADIAHISNEVSFTPDCPEPNPIGGTSFCSQDEYFALLEEIGTDVIELTGNHLNDWGADNVLRTIDMYEAAGMDYFGGGRDTADAARAAVFEHHGNRIAMVGCNFFGPSYAWTTESSAGSRACGPDFFEQITQLRDEGYVVIATQQYTESYQYAPLADQADYFRRIADAGAAAVSGSQGHHAQGFEFHEGAFIHYGLGNLFFDQMDMLGTRQAFVDVYNIYDGRLINVDLWTGLIENFSTPRLMTSDEREAALQSVFQASGW